MPRYIKPMEVRRVAQPSDDPAGDGEWALDSSELEMFDHFAQEPMSTAGTRVEVWQRSLKKTKVDALYGEPVETGFDGPFVVKAHVEWPESTPEVGEEGMNIHWPSGVWIPRKTLEDVGAGPMNEGDIVRFWNLPYFENEATRNVKSKTPGLFFDVIKVNDDGHIHDQAEFVAFRCDLKRRLSAPPELQFKKAKAEGDDC